MTEPVQDVELPAEDASAAESAEEAAAAAVEEDEGEGGPADQPEADEG